MIEGSKKVEYASTGDMEMFVRVVETGSFSAAARHFQNWPALRVSQDQSSGDAARPRFGWFFGRDALWSLYAVNNHRDFVTTRQEFEFLLRQRRADGKIMHEWSQTAGLMDWQSLPYECASSDVTPLLQMAADDYLKISGAASFIGANWKHLQRAWHFETSHDSHHVIYNNSEGLGWVESWVPKMPHQEIYLAASDEMASVAFADLVRATGHSDLAEQAAQRARDICGKIEQGILTAGAEFLCV